MPEQIPIKVDVPDEIVLNDPEYRITIHIPLWFVREELEKLAEE